MLTKPDMQQARKSAEVYPSIKYAEISLNIEKKNCCARLST